jgi:hypothetical protein
MSIANTVEVFNVKAYGAKGNRGVNLNCIIDVEFW